MAKKKKSDKRHDPAAQRVQHPPKWGLLVAAVSAFLLVNVALVIMQKIGVTNTYIRTGVVFILAVFAGITARPLTLALQKRFSPPE